MVLNGLALGMQWQAALCVAVFRVTRRSSAFAKVSSELVISQQERELGAMMDSSCKMQISVTAGNKIIIIRKGTENKM